MPNMRHIAIAAATLGVVAAPVAPVVAKGGNANRVVKTGHCSDGSSWTLKVKPDAGRLEVEFEVDQNRNGARWNVVLRRNGATAARGSAVTRAPSGSFSFNRRIAGASGTKVTATATRGGATCRGAATAA
jgi:hypothetical protein